MPFAPYGVRVLARKAVSHTTPGVNLSKSFRPQAPVTGLFGAQKFSTSRSAASNAHNIFTHSQSLLSRFFARLLAPNIRIPLPPQLSGRALQTNTTHFPLGRTSIQQGFSLPVRFTISRPLGIGPFFPRAPAAPTRVATNVGLGSVRRFTSARPLFQNLVENVPIAVRALYEAKLDESKPNSKKLRPKRMSTRRTKKEVSEKSQILAAPGKAESTSEELKCYFATPIPAVTTYLLVPLAPTPTSRMPLTSSVVYSHGDGPSLLHPLEEFGTIHLSHELHSLRVSSLFSRLDNGDVWSKGVKCTAYSHGFAHGPDGEGACTILKLEFVGWTMAQVKSVIGECGTGWCVLREESEDEFMATESDTCSELSESGLLVDPAVSLVLPTLDLSTDSRPGSSMSMSSFAADSDSWSDILPPNIGSSRGRAGFDSTQSFACSGGSGWSAYGLSSQFLDIARL